MFDYILAAMIAVLSGLFYNTYRKQQAAIKAISRLALSVAELEKKIDAIDESTGADVYRLRHDFEAFKEDYGDAAIEEMRQAANQQKAWADGINNIMSFGARYQGGGNAK